MRNKTIILLLCFYPLLTHAQDDALSSVQNRAGSWRHLVLQEKLFVHTDKSFYLAGEILWCRLYCVDGYTNRPQGVSKLAYVEILDAGNRPVVQGKIALENGFGEGSFALPPSVNSGTYRLRAYTNWMKNFGPAIFFEQPITIVNTIKGIDTAAITRPDSSRQYTIAFFPEGGDLITGLPSCVAFEMTDDAGKNIDAQGAIVTAGNDTVTTFRPQKNGLGVFQLTPQPGYTYTAVLHCPDGITRSWPLPPVLPKGYTLHLRDEGQQIVLTAHASPGLDLQDTRLFMTSAFFNQPPVITGDSIHFTIPRSRLQDGNNRLTLFDAFGHPLAERQYFVPPHERLQFTAATDLPAYTTRQKIRLDIGLTDSSSAHASIAVYRLDSLQRYPETDIFRYLWGQSEWTGASPSAGSLDDTTLTALYSLTHGWTRFRWSDILSHPDGPHLYPPEIRGQIITGRLTDAHTGTPAKNVIAYLAAPGRIFRFATAETDTGGHFQFDLKDFYGQDGIVINTDMPYKITTYSPFSEQYTDRRLPAFRLARGQLQLLQRYNVGIQVQNIFTGDSLRQFSLHTADTLPFFGHTGYTYLLDNYIRFTTMEEVLREYVREINVTRANGHLHFVMLDEPARSIFRDQNSLVLVDGVPIPQDSIFNYDPLKVSGLQVIPQEYDLGPAHFSGIASFTTYKGDFEGLGLDSNTLQIDYEGLQYHRQFYSPAYPTTLRTESRMPDFRNVLYWNPDLRVGQAPSPVEFYASDLPGEYLIVIQGLSPDGKAGVTYRRFTVRAVGR